MKVIRRLCITLLLVSTACAPIQLDPPLPSPYPLHVGITPSIRDLYHEDLYRCAANNSHFVMILDTTPSRKLDLESSDMIIQLGEPEGGLPFFAAQIGLEQIVLISSPDLDVSFLTVELIKDQFTAMKPQYSIWTYPKNHEIEQFFSKLILHGENQSAYTQLVPNPEAMIEIISSKEKSIGYSLKSYIDGDLEIIPIGQALQDSLKLPVLLISKQEPQGEIRNFVSCLQGN